MRLRVRDANDVIHVVEDEPDDVTFGITVCQTFFTYGPAVLAMHLQSTPIPGMQIDPAPTTCVACAAFS